MVEFEWNPAKAASNLRKHKISFDLAATVFQDPFMRSFPDKGYSGLEERWITMGYDQDGRLLVVSHTYSERDSDNIFVRIISARRATRKERHQYETVK